ncbi:DUF2065 domain-containing protein [Aliiroseovarius sp. YM-037]|uniref:DUF2065 domain-containing protein n=1 Tax=Aliiroseovarius sp. YM-037 TaxID=3341728 RepID=UPI003A7F842E
MATLLLGLGLVFAVEGLVLALAPSRIEDILETLRLMSIERRRMIGLFAIAAGVAIIWLAKAVLGA